MMRLCVTSNCLKMRKILRMLEDGKKQVEVAAEMNISQAKVSIIKSKYSKMHNTYLGEKNKKSQ